ncbi:MAG: glutaredoxin family protein [Spirochaetaceae bacterium]|nr:MAG: glutaredoxin family protein [Spirochaetaceae bacterium]
MNSKLNFTHIEGEITKPELVMYSLSTCAFCRRAKQFLQDNGFAFSFIHVDELDQETKAQVKADIKARFKSLPVFPVLVINDEEVVFGFAEAKWRKTLLQGDEGKN